MKVNYNENPTLADVVVFDLITTDIDGFVIDVYSVNKVTIYFIERGATAENVNQYTKTVSNEIYTEYFKEAIPVAIFGTSDFPAWIGTDLDNAFLTKVDYDEFGIPLTGVYRLEWNQELMKEGDYVLCYEWTPIPAADHLIQNLGFYLSANSRNTTSIPSHFTVPEKYEVLLERYLPEMFKMMLADGDLTPSVLDKLNKAIAKGFTSIEDQVNQIVDLIDANSVNDYLLPYLGNYFDLDLKDKDTALWRKQIKRAIPLYKKKGTLDGLKEALANSDVKFNKLTRLWQVVSPFTWQDGFVVTQEQVDGGIIEFVLSKLAILPVDVLNFELYYRESGDSDYTLLTDAYVSLANSGGKTTVTWIGDMLSSGAIELFAGDVIRVVYKINPVTNQTIEDYIRSLPLADLRDVLLVTAPHKNWNVRVIGEDDPLFDMIIPSRHPFQYPISYGKIRTEFPYSENIYNMDEYNGSSRDSLDPCDLDKDFMDKCSSCQGSKFTIDVEIENLSNDRIDETNDIIKEFVPFHAVIHSVNYTGSVNEFMLSPAEDIEYLCTIIQNDNVVATQMNFNRLIEEGSSNVLELKRNMLASTTLTAHSGTGVNLAVSLFSPGIQFGTLGVDTDSDTYLEILSGTDMGEYKVGTANKFTVDIIQGQPDTINWSIDPSGFPFRLSNEMFNGTVDIDQSYEYTFSDVNIEFIDFGTVENYKVVVTSGPYAGTYNVNSINPNNTLTLASFPTTATITGLNYELRTASNNLRYTGTTGSVSSLGVGKVTMDVNAFDYGIRSGDYVEYSGTQYQARGVDEFIWIDGYTGGNVGGASVKVYHRLVELATGYLEIKGMKLTGVVPVISNVAETNQFLDNYLILIGSNYYQISSISGSDMILSGTVLSWGLIGTPVNYSIVQFIKTSPIMTQSIDNPFGGLEFDRLDRRGNESVEIITETVMPMFLRASMLNNQGEQLDAMIQQEQIWYNIEYRE